MQQSGFSYSSDFTRTCPTLGQNNGLLILSKYPITETRNVSFNKTRFFSVKGWLEADIKLGDDYHLKLVTTHLEHKIEELKCHQLDELFGEVFPEGQKQQPTVVCGDFNTGPNIPELDLSYKKYKSLIAKHALFDLFPGPEKTYRDEIKKTAKTKLKNPNFAIDHMLVTEGMANSVVSQSVGIVEHYDMIDGKRFYVSDHKGIKFTLDTKPADDVCSRN